MHFSSKLILSVAFLSIAVAGQNLNNQEPAVVTSTAADAEHTEA